MGKVHRKGTAVIAKQATKRHRRNCRSAPQVPTGLSLTFHRRMMSKRARWRATARWDPVDDDVAGRALNVEGYQAQLRATDASGEPVETQGQVESAIESGAGFTVHAGSAAVNGIARELNASPDEIKKTLTGLTTGIECAVNFYAMLDLVASSPRLRFMVWNTTNNVEVVAKNETLESQSPRIYATLPFTPVVGKSYEARVRWVSGTGIGRLSHVAWHDRGNAAQWSMMVPDDETPLAALWAAIPRPKSWFYQTRVRTLNRHQGHRCWSAWTSWTTATRPADGVKRGPPVPTNPTMIIDKVEGSRGKAWRVKCKWNELSWWVPPDDDPVEGAALYHVQLAVSNNGGTTTANIRRKTVEADDEDANVTANAQFMGNIKGKRHYRFRVKAQDEQGRRGAWSGWTAWASPGGVPDPPRNLAWSNPTPAVFVARWDDPLDVTDVDRYRVQVIRANTSTVVDDGYTSGNRWVYHIPKADRRINHRARVRSIEDPLILDVDEDIPTGWDTEEESSTVTSGDVPDDAPIIGDIINDNDDPVLRVSGFPRCKLRYTAGQNLADDTLTYVRWGTEDIDTDNFHGATTDNLAAGGGSAYEQTLPFTGQYLVIANATFAADVAGRRIVQILLNGTGWESTSTSGTGGGSTVLSCPTVVDATAGDTLSVRLFQQTGGLLAVPAARLTIVYMGGA